MKMRAEQSADKIEAGQVECTESVVGKEAFEPGLECTSAIFAVGHSFWSKKNLKEVLFFCYPFQRFGEELFCRASENNKHWWTKNPCKNILCVELSLDGVQRKEGREYISHRLKQGIQTITFVQCII